MSNIALVREALLAGEGVVRLAPCWVPRSFLMPGGRLKLDPRDLYALGAHRGGIDERWFSSTTNAANGPGTPEDEGLSYIAIDGQRVLLKEAVDAIGDEILGSGCDGANTAAGTCSASSSTTWGRFRITCTRWRSTPGESAARASRKPTTSRRNTTSRTTIFLTRSWAWSRAPRKTMCGNAWSAGTRATTASCTIRKPTAASRARDGRWMRASCTRRGRW